MVLFVVLSVIPSLATGSIVNEGEPIPYNSWIQAWSENGIWGGQTYYPAEMRAFIVQGDVVFEPPGFTQFSYAFWSGKVIHPKYARAVTTLPNSQYVSFQTIFSSEDPFTIDFLVYGRKSPNNNNEPIKLLGMDRFLWLGHGWALGGHPVEEYYLHDPYPSQHNTNMVPIPPTVWLFMSGLVALGVARKRIR